MSASRGPRVVCAILAAGRSSRMGVEKTALHVAGRSLLERALEAAAGHDRIVIASAANAAGVPALPRLRTIRNDEPERGMAHSLRLADAAVADRESALAVLLADMPYVDAALVARIVAARGDADVAYPVRDGTPGHPVVFGPRPRAAIASLPDGDTLRGLRSDARWTRVEVAVADDGAFRDVDTPADVERLEREASVVESAAVPSN